jgi:hypothetical protein
VPPRNNSLSYFVPDQSWLVPYIVVGVVVVLLSVVAGVIATLAPGLLPYASVAGMLVVIGLFGWIAWRAWGDIKRFFVKPS